MSKPPILNPKDLLRLLGKLGFVNTRRTGSHFFFRHPDGRTTVIPVHKGHSIGPGLMRGILADLKMSTDEFRKLL